MNAAPYTDYMYRFIESVLDDIGPRESCSDNEKRLGQRLAMMWRELGHEVSVEKFRCNPKAFLGFIPFSALLYLAATVSYWVWPFVCFLLALAAGLLIWFELLRYREFADRLFPEAEGENVVAVVKPRGEIRRRVIVSAHQDSAYEFNLWYFLKTAAVPVNVIGFGAVLVPLLGGLAKTLAGDAGDAHGFDVVGYVCMGLYPVVGLNLFFHTYSVVPGAMDDLAGVSVLAGAAKALAEAGADGQPALEHTEVRLLAASSEEAGLRGAKRYVTAHLDEMRQLPTYGIFVDGIYDERHLTIIKHELFTSARHDPRMIQLARDVARDNGWTPAEHIIPLGATDATPFTTSGIPSVVLLCQDASTLVPNYHTRLDTIELVRPESLRVTLQMVLGMIQRIDAQGV